MGFFTKRPRSLPVVVLIIFPCLNKLRKGATQHLPIKNGNATEIVVFNLTEGINYACVFVHRQNLLDTNTQVSNALVIRVVERYARYVLGNCLVGLSQKLLLTYRDDVCLTDYVHYLAIPDNRNSVHSTNQKFYQREQGLAGFDKTELVPSAKIYFVRFTRSNTYKKR